MGKMMIQNPNILMGKRNDGKFYPNPSNDRVGRCLKRWALGKQLYKPSSWHI